MKHTKATVVCVVTFFLYKHSDIQNHLVNPTPTQHYTKLILPIKNSEVATHLHFPKGNLLTKGDRQL